MNKSDLEQFFTKEKATQGRRMPLYTPAGSATDHWLLILGIDSDAFKMAEMRSKRELPKLMDIESEDERFQKLAELQREAVASLVAGWSFELEFTKENVIEFLKNAPQVEEAVNTFAGRRTLFFAPEPKSS